MEGRLATLLSLPTLERSCTCSPNVSAAVRTPPPRQQHATPTGPADGPCALPVLPQALDVLWTRGGPSRSGQTPRTPRPPPSPGHITRSPRARPPSPTVPDRRRIAGSGPAAVVPTLVGVS